MKTALTSDEISLILKKRRNKMNKAKKVQCSTWSIQIIPGGLKIKYGRWPNMGELKLYDLYDQDVEDLADLFTREVKSQNRWKAKQAKLSKLK